MALEGMLAKRMYFPEARLQRAPEGFDLPYRDVAIASGAFTLHGWLIEGSGSPWLWSHGNGGNISHRLEHAAALHRAFGMPLLLYDYRGYGRSEGSPSESGTYQDAHAALRALTQMLRCDGEDVICWGQSLGGAVATELAVSTPVKALVLESTFTSVGAMVGRATLGPLAAPFKGVYDTESRIGSLAIPVLVMHGSRDDVVPAGMGRRLFDAARPPKTFRVIAGAGHDAVHRGEGYLQIVADFLKAL